MYKEIWEASCGQVFPCLREVGNAFDPFAVSVVRDSAGYNRPRAQKNFGTLLAFWYTPRFFPLSSCVSHSSVYTSLTTFGELELSSTGRRNFSSAISNTC